MAIEKKYILLSLLLSFAALTSFAKDLPGMISGKVLSSDGGLVDYATVYLKGTAIPSSDIGNRCTTI